MRVKGLVFSLALVGTLFLATAAHADYPADCLGPQEPSAAECGDITDAGCCDDTGRVVYCLDGALYCIDCAEANPECGWSAEFGYYDCGTDGSGDPSGTNPYDCVGCDPECVDPEVCFQGECCTPDCTDKECGDNGCGGSCGECGPGTACDDTFACAPLPTCEMVQEVSCDDVIEGDTTGHENLLDSYSCTGWDESGPEVGYLFVSGVDDVVTVSIEYGEEYDLDLLALADACTVDDCIDNGNMDVEVTTEAGKSYYFVVDGYGGDAGAFTLTVKCKSTCVPDCSGGPCTEDGCGDLCACEGEGEVCFDGACCVPSCEGKACGDDGCGGDTCGECADGGVCFENVCHSGPGCEATPEVTGCGGCPCETCVCELDDYCCSTEWDGICVNECVESCGGCFTPENCGDGECLPEEFENCSNCPEDCGCPDGESCFNSECCTPQCDGLECGDDGCGGTCGECGPGMGCSEGVCVESSGPEECLGPQEPSAADCGDVSDIGCCDNLGRVLYCMEGALYCIDCAGVNPECGWSPDNGWYDCGTDGAEDPSGDNPLVCIACDPACGPGEKCVNGECVECVPDCDGKTCGSDGCGGSCGECAGTCAEGVCHAGPGCEPTPGVTGCDGCDCEACVCAADDYCCTTEWDDICVGLCINDCGGCPSEPPVGECGDGTCDADENCDTCADDCGCAQGETCEAGECVTCEPQCDGVVCGDDGCGGSCGECGAGEECVEGACQCAPDCGTAVCGDDGCGGSCGTCAAGEECTDGQCLCVPQCEGLECGDDGCGGSCGGCGGTAECVEGSCQPIDIDQDVVEQDTGSQADTAGEEPAPKKEDSGCTTGSNANPMAAFLFLLMALAIAGVRRFGVRA